MSKNKTKQNFLKGLFLENPLFVSVLGTCPALATTKTLESAIGMGLLFTIVLICSNVLISLVKNFIADEIRTPAYIVIIAAFVTMVQMLAEAFMPELYSTLGVFISLIVVNCIVLGRAEAYASKNNVFDSFIDAIGMGVGYTLAIASIAIIRELFGTGYLTFGEIFTFIPYIQIPIFGGFGIMIFQQPAGAFIVFAIILAVMAFIQNEKKTRKEVKARIEKQKAAQMAALKAAQEKGENK